MKKESMDFSLLLKTESHIFVRCLLAAASSIDENIQFFDESIMTKIASLIKFIKKTWPDFVKKHRNLFLYDKFSSQFFNFIPTLLAEYLYLKNNKSQLEAVREVLNSKPAVQKFYQDCAKFLLQK